MNPAPTRRLLRRDELQGAPLLREALRSQSDLRDLVVQAADLREVAELAQADVRGCVFLGCTLDDAQELDLIRRGAAIFPTLGDLPYSPYRGQLYSVEELLEGYEEGGYTATRDFRIYAHYDRERRHARGISLRQSLAQSLHDHAIDDALSELLRGREPGEVVAVMGGHGCPRSSASYLEVARLTYLLTRSGYFVASGGGPGIMEAANLGAYLACFADPAVVESAVAELAAADTFSGGEAEGTAAYLAAVEAYFASAFEVAAVYGGRGPRAAEIDRRFGREGGRPGESLAIPTWFYGHEPTNLFCTRVAKYFSNSLREDGLLAIATGGVIFAPGSAGTLQEVFMDLAQNHYATFRFRSPMVFLGSETYAPLVRYLEAFVAQRTMQEVYGDLITLVDRAEEACAFLRAHPPRLRPEATPLYELLDSSPGGPA